MTTGEQMLSKAKTEVDLDEYRDLHWTGSFADYLDLVRRDARVTRSSFERLYDMILSYGTRHPMVMGSADGIRHGDRKIEELIQREALLRDPFGQRVPLHQLHGDEPDTIRLLN